MYRRCHQKSSLFSIPLRCPGRLQKSLCQTQNGLQSQNTITKWTFIFLMIDDVYLYPPATTIQHRHVSERQIPFTKSRNFMNVIVLLSFFETKVWLHHYINFVAKSNLLITNLLTNLHSSIPKLRLHYGSDDDGAIKGGHGIFEVPRWQVAPVGKMWGCFFFHFRKVALGSRPH